MKRSELTLSVCLILLAGFVGREVRALRGEDSPPPPLALTARTSAGTMLTDADPAIRTVASESFERPVVVTRTSQHTEPPLDPRELRRRLLQGASGTYIGELLRSRDSALARWPDRLANPLRVWVVDSSSLPDWNDAFPGAVRDAFDTWTQVGIPLRFTFVLDSASADIRVNFIPRFSTSISGKTVWSRDEDYWLVSSNITLALSHPGGGTVTPQQMRAIALHEVGHLLGLDHTDDPTNIMAPRIRVRDLSDQDRATVRLLYSVPAGPAR